MENRTESVRHNVVSIRINNQELAMIRELTGQTKQKTSDLLREALHLFIGSAAHGRNDGFTCQKGL